MFNRLKIIVFVFVLGLAYLAWYLTRPLERFVYGLSPIDRDHAILLTRHNGDSETRFFVELVKADGEHLWTSETTPLSALEALGHSGVAADAERIYLLSDRNYDGHLAAIALDRKSGGRLWQHEVTPGPSTARIGPMLFLSPERLLIVHPVGGEKPEETLTALDLKDGRVLWPSGTAERVVAKRVETASAGGPGRFVITNPDFDAPERSSRELDAATGRVLRGLPFFWHHCETPAGLLGMGREGLAFVPRTDSGLGLPLRLGESGRFRGLIHEPVCGLYRDIAVLSTRDPSRPEGSALLAGFNLSTGALLWRYDWSFVLSLQKSLDADGHLPRFYPVLYTAESERADSQRLVVIDLATGTPVHEDDIPVARGFGRVLATSDRGFILDVRSGVLTPIDQTTGKPSIPVNVEPLRSLLHIAEAQLRFGRLWSFDRTFAAPDELPYGVLDLATLETLFRRAQ
jgi:hypothetical protein